MSDQRQDHDDAVERTLGWSVALGARYTFQNTLPSGCLWTCPAQLLAGVHGIIEGLYCRYVDAGMGAEAAFQRSVERITGPVWTTRLSVVTPTSGKLATGVTHC
ncbi:hypothetical protein ACFXDO_08785 [Streptomyces nigra]|uniref:hypothetical protein n=1 Tax=Streptomyces nigra TaxID=1827580 RepID=UPI003675D557